ncbi:hypothetical protein C8F01DRAFT_1033351 [Mycena amicta]|nr:hypothetical protein C8F01DRAFT_1033351 [Mycena amicta]
MPSESEPSLPATAGEQILIDCPQFRILAVGRSGVGKSSLISHTFGVDMQSTDVSTDRPGEANIAREIHSPQNLRFVSHDSMGFEPGNVEKLQNVKTFISQRSAAGVALKERLHAIWLCIQVPATGGQALETGDEEILELAVKQNVPVVVVFTQYDRLLSMINLDLDEPGITPEEIRKRCMPKATRDFEECCNKPLTNIGAKLNVKFSCICTSGAVFLGGRDCDDLTCICIGLSAKREADPNSEGLDNRVDREALYDLVHKTCDVVEKSIGVDISIAYAMGQRSSAELKIKDCVKVGMKSYWAGLASSGGFLGYTLQKCLKTVHKDVVESWHFYDEDRLLQDGFMNKIKMLAQLAAPDDPEAKSQLWFTPENQEAALNWMGIAGAGVAAAASPVIGAVGVTLWFAKFVGDVYRQTPETLRCFMAYVIDLTLVLNELFYLLPIASRRVTDANITEAITRYGASGLGMVHSEIRRYGSSTEWAKRKAAEERMKAIILHYSSPEYRLRSFLGEGGEDVN